MQLFLLGSDKIKIINFDNHAQLVTKIMEFWNPRFYQSNQSSCIYIKKTGIFAGRATVDQAIGFCHQKET